MEKLVIFPKFPIAQDDLLQIEERARSADLICSPGKRDPAFNYYSVDWYRKQYVFGDCEIKALFDLNLTQYLIDIARGKHCQSCHRQTAALMTVLVLSDISIEPGIGLVESSKSNTIADSEMKLSTFRLADNLNPVYYAAIALERLDKILPEMLPLPSENHNDSIPNHLPSEWTFYKGHLLKMLQLLQKEKLSRKQRIYSYWEWVWKDYQFDTTASLYALFLFSGGTKGMLSTSWSGDVLEKNLSNISWDLALVRDWIRRIKKEKTSEEYWILCSYDKVVRKIANQIFDDFAAGTNPRVELLLPYWKESEAVEIASFCQQLETDMENPARRMIQFQDSSGLLPIISEMERQLFT